MMKRVWTIMTLVLALPLLVMGGFSQVRADGYKVALVLPGIISDKSFNQALYEGLMMAKEEMNLEVAFSEKVAQPDQAEALADYARRGYQFVAGGGGEFQDAVERVADRFPDTTFMVINGNTVPPNKNASILRLDYLGMGYALGYLAGKMSKTGVGAFIGGQQIAACKDELLGFEHGFKAANPNGKALGIWTNDWDDVAKGKEAALTVISQGADIIWPTMDNAIVGSYQGAKEQGKFALGIYYDHYKDWPDTILQSALFKWANGVLEMIRLANAGKLEGKEYLLGFESSAVSIGTYSPAVPEELRKEVGQIIEDIKAGRIDLPPRN